MLNHGLRGWDSLPAAGGYNVCYFSIVNYGFSLCRSRCYHTHNNVRGDSADVKDEDSNAMSTIAVVSTEHDKENEYDIEKLPKTSKLNSL